MNLGTYTYKHIAYVDGARVLLKHSMRVAILAEHSTQYKVKYLGFHASGAAVNSLHWVAKKNVRLDAPQLTPAKDLQNIRLPYKD